MKIISYNVNGIRSAMNKGLLEWLRDEQPDIFCVQELKAMRDQVDCKEIEELGYQVYWFSAQKKGYSGVAVFSRLKVLKVILGNGYPRSDEEGRVIHLIYEKFQLINAYFPSGSSGDHRQEYKYQWLSEFSEYVQSKKNELPLIIVGDYNICHQEIDIHDPKSNKNTSGFLPEERAWMDQWFGSGFLDTFRYLNPDKVAYSWWSMRAASRARNKGWRIDYISVSENLRPAIQNALILTEVKHSDHCPISVELAIENL